MKMNWYPEGAGIRSRVMPYLLILMGLASHLSTALMSTCMGIGALILLFDIARHHEALLAGRWDARMGKVLVIFAITLFVSAAFSLERGRSFHEAVSTLFGMLPFFLALFYVRSWRLAAAVVGAFAVSAFLNDIIACLQVYFHLNFGWGNRPVGFSKSPTFLGSFMLMTIPLLFLVPARLFSHLPWKVFCWGCSALSLVVLFLTQTRGAWIAFFCAVIVIVIVERRYRKACLGGIAVLLLICFVAFHAYPEYYARAEQTFNPEFQSNTERVLMWTAALQIFADHPIVGIGQDEFGLVYNRDYISSEAKERPTDPNNPRSGHGHPHNNFLKVLSERGLVGIAGFLLLHGFVLVQLVRALRRVNGGLAYAFALDGILTFIGVQIEGLTDTNLQLAHIARTYWMLMGLCLAAGQMKDDASVMSERSQENM